MAITAETKRLITNFDTTKAADASKTTSRNSVNINSILLSF